MSRSHREACGGRTVTWPGTAELAPPNRAIAAAVALGQADDNAGALGRRFCDQRIVQCNGGAPDRQGTIGRRIAAFVLRRGRQLPLPWHPGRTPIHRRMARARRPPTIVPPPVAPNGLKGSGVEATLNPVTTSRNQIQPQIRTRTVSRFSFTRATFRWTVNPAGGRTSRGLPACLKAAWRSWRLLWGG